VPPQFTPLHRGGAGPPLVCLHGVTDTWRTWELVLPALERHHEVLAPTLPGHAGGPALRDPVTADALADAVEDVMDASGVGEAHLVGNSLGGHLALRLAARGRARSVVALAPAGGWRPGDGTLDRVLAHNLAARDGARLAAPHADRIAATDEGRRQATALITRRYRHIPAPLVAHQILGVAACAGLPELVAAARREDWGVDAAAVRCPVRFVWGLGDALLHWPGAAARLREAFGHADWVELDDVGHCPQLDVPRETAELILGLTAAGRRGGPPGGGAPAGRS